jgi:hypothetical protein
MKLQSIETCIIKLLNIISGLLLIVVSLLTLSLSIVSGIIMIPFTLVNKVLIKFGKYLENEIKYRKTLF